MTDALTSKMTGGECPEEARPYLSASMLDMAREAVTRMGQSVKGMSPDEVFHRAAHTTSDFPLVVSNAAGNVALATYKAAESSLKRICRQRTLPNFKPSTAIRLGEAGQLEPLAEDGQITHTSRAGTGETMKLSTFARGLNVSRELLVNDDLGLLGDLTSTLGEAAAQTEASILVEIVTGNPVLSDGTSVFDASRGNTGAGALDEAGLSAGRLALRKRQGLDGQPIAVAPKFLVVPPEMETVAEKLLAAITPTTTDDANVATRDLTLLVEPRLADGEYFLFADPARLAALSYAYLSAAQGVQIQRAEAWDTLGLKFRAFLDFGAGWLDWRPAQRVEVSQWPRAFGLSRMIPAGALRLSEPCGTKSSPAARPLRSNSPRSTRAPAVGFATGRQTSTGSTRKSTLPKRRAETCGARTARPTPSTLKRPKDCSHEELRATG